MENSSSCKMSDVEHSDNTEENYGEWIETEDTLVKSRVGSKEDSGYRDIYPQTSSDSNSSPTIESGEYRYHLAIIVPDLPTQWSGPLRSMSADVYSQAGSNIQRFIKAFCKDFMRVFYKLEIGGLTETNIWIGTLQSEQQVIDIAEMARFVVGVNTVQSSVNPHYRVFIDFACHHLHLTERYLPVFIGLDAPYMIKRMKHCLILSSGVDHHSDITDIGKTVNYMQQTVFRENMNPWLYLKGPFSFQKKKIVEEDLQNRKEQPNKRYPYSLIGDVESPPVQELHSQVRAHITEIDPSLDHIEPFVDWKSETGRKPEVQLREKMEESATVIMINQACDGDYVKHTQEVALMQDIKKGKQGNMVPVVLHQNETPDSLETYSSINIKPGKKPTRKQLNKVAQFVGQS